MAATILGFNGLTEIGRRTTLDPYRGVTQEVIYHGPKAAAREGYNNLVNAGVLVELDETLLNPTAKLTVRTPDYSDDPSNTIPVSTWELVNNMGVRSGYEHPKSTDLGDSTLSAIKEAIRKNTNPTSLTGNAATLYRHMNRGQDSFFSPQPVFRLTQVISRRGSVDVSYANWGKIYGSNSVINETGAPTLYAHAINESFANYPFSVPTGFVLGWLKMAPTFNNVAGGRMAVTIEYLLDAWSNYYYPYYG